MKIKTIALALIMLLSMPRAFSGEAPAGEGAPSTSSGSEGSDEAIDYDGFNDPPFPHHINIQELLAPFSSRP